MHGMRDSVLGIRDSVLGCQSRRQSRLRPLGLNTEIRELNTGGFAACSRPFGPASQLQTSYFTPPLPLPVSNKTGHRKPATGPTRVISSG